MNLNDHFDHIYCINLDRRSDRWESAQKEFDRIGLKDVERFSASDGSQLNIQSRLLKGEVGIIDSHKRILTDALNKGYRKILILEDDVEFHPDFNNLFEQASSEIPNDYGFLYIGGNINHFTPIKISEHICKASSALALHALGVSISIYEQILSMIDYSVQIDVLYAYINDRMRSYIMMPRLAWQKPDYSDIQNCNVDYTFLRD